MMLEMLYTAEFSPEITRMQSVSSQAVFSFPSSSVKLIFVYGSSGTATRMVTIRTFPETGPASSLTQDKTPRRSRMLPANSAVLFIGTVI